MSTARPNLVEGILSACRSDPVLGRRGGTLVVAVSGGPDSTALLHGLWRAAPSLKLKVVAAHLDHRLRRGSAGDAAYVARLCDSLGVRLVSSRSEVPLETKGEDGLRRVRHQFLEEVAAAERSRTVALGHTADDQAETVLLHLLRGAGLEGLAAMAVREGVRFRPLLRLWRWQVDAYCRQAKLEPRLDPSNRSLRFTRNRVRHELIPLLEQRFNPRVKVGLVRLAESARAERQVVTDAAARWLRRNPEPYDRGALARQPPAVEVEIIRRVWAVAAGGGAAPGDAAHLSQALGLLQDSPRQGMVELGAGLYLHVDKDHFWVGRARRR